MVVGQIAYAGERQRRHAIFVVADIDHLRLLLVLERFRSPLDVGPREIRVAIHCVDERLEPPLRPATGFRGFDLRASSSSSGSGSSSDCSPSITLRLARPRRRFGNGSGSRGGEPAASDGGSGGASSSSVMDATRHPRLRSDRTKCMSGTSEHGGATPSFVEGHSAAQRVALALFQTSPVRGSGVMPSRLSGVVFDQGNRLQTRRPVGRCFYPGATGTGPDRFRGDVSNQKRFICDCQTNIGTAKCKSSLYIRPAIYPSVPSRSVSSYSCREEFFIGPSPAATPLASSSVRRFPCRKIGGRTRRPCQALALTLFQSARSGRTTSFADYGSELNWLVPFRPFADLPGRPDTVRDAQHSVR